METAKAGRVLAKEISMPIGFDERTTGIFPLLSVLYLSMTETQVIDKPRTVTANVELFLMWDEPTKQFVSYIPTLELSSYDETEQGAFDCLMELIPDMMDEMVERKTLIPFLLKLGWTITLKPEPSFIPPRLTLEQLLMERKRVEVVAISIPS